MLSILLIVQALDVTHPIASLTISLVQFGLSVLEYCSSKAYETNLAFAMVFSLTTFWLITH